MLLVFKGIIRRPVPKIQTYLKYGFVIMEHDIYCCPRCGKTLNAGPDYQPQYCSECGQRVTFAEVKWREDRKKCYASVEEEEKYESIRDRVV